MNAFCILAAGKGVRCQKVNKLHKCLLPIDNKAVISHVIDKAPLDADIIIAVGHQKKIVKDYCLAAHPGRKFTFVEVDNFDKPGSGPGYSLQCCKKHLQRPFYLVCSDCIVKESLPDLHTNWLGVFPVNDPVNWSTAAVNDGKITEFKNKSVDGYDHAFIGIAGIKDYSAFWSEMKHSDKEYEMVSAFYKPEAYGELRAEFFTWFDTGTPENYNNSKSHLGESSLGMSKEIDEITYKVGDRCVKVFGDSQVASGRVERANLLKGLTPPVLFAGEHVYAYEWVQGETMYQKGNLESFAKFLDWCEKHLWLNNTPTSDFMYFYQLCYKFYHDKTLGRVKTYLQKKGLAEDKSELINGRNCKSIEYYLDNIDWGRLCQGIPVLFHGDLQFENIIHDGDKFFLIDWRDCFAGERKFGDLYYDLAKLYGGLSMCYQKIKEGKFNFDQSNYSFEMLPGLEELRFYFENWILKRGLDLYKVRVLTALIYLNMAPLHTPKFDQLLFSHSKYLLSML